MVGVLDRLFQGRDGRGGIGPQTLLGLAAGIASGDDINQGLSNAFQLAGRGLEADRTSATRRRLAEVAESGSFGQLSPGLQAAIQADPSLARNVFGAQAAAEIAANAPLTAAQRATIAAARARATAPTTLERNLTAAGLQRGTPEFREAVIQGTRRGTTVNVGDRDLGKQFSKSVVDRVNTIETEAERARASSLTTDQLRAVLSNPDVFTGSGGEAVLSAKRALSTIFGVDVSGLADAEVASNLSKQLSLDLTAKLKGAISNKELDTVLQLPPGLRNSPGANQILLGLHDIANSRALLRLEAQNRVLENSEGLTPTQLSVKLSRDLAKVDRQIGQRARQGVADLRALGAQTKTRSPLAGIPINTMNIDQLRKLKPNELTRAQKEQAADRLDQIRSQGGILAR